MVWHYYTHSPYTDEKKIKFSSYLRKFRGKQLQSHIWLMASSYMGKYLRIFSYIRKPFLLYDFATAPLWISLYMRKFWFSFSLYCNSAEVFHIYVVEDMGLNFLHYRGSIYFKNLTIETASNGNEETCGAVQTNWSTI